MTIKNITKKTDCPEKIKIDQLVKKLIDADPKARPKIKEILETIRSIGEDVEIQTIDPLPYIEQIKNLILTDPNSLSLNNDIMEIVEGK